MADEKITSSKSYLGNRLHRSTEPTRHQAHLQVHGFDPLPIRIYPATIHCSVEPVYPPRMMELWIFDRSGCLISGKFSVHKKPEWFAKAVVNDAAMSLRHL
ncbi:hypothetical protein CDD80_4560 [Ophiocordyceps camponoti-rufipedis]|uniref:Fungal-type protein kinase domain-containing protein n=1 Tax=Ophiocordyceps camponoti-rufipedis TaxID=2004952 RepID=A0A2C5XHB7_9HYPO|nr:hypothetical protein CDD80_4560 [Ophiocordyceps camponoti-rufipedis]